MNVFTRSWKLTKLSFGVINKDRELLVFALLSMVFSSLVSAAFIYPALLSVPGFLPGVADPQWSQQTVNIVRIVAILGIYFGLAFVATFFNVCTVYTTKVRLEGGNATFGESLGFAFSRLGLIVAWSLVSATVGLLLRLLHEAGQRTGRIGAFLVNLLVGLLGAAWSVITLFVVPVLVYENKGPFASIRRSVEVIKKTWGESLIKGIGLGLIQFLVHLLLLVLILVAAVLFLRADNLVGLWTSVGVGILLFLFSGLVFSVANTVFNTALYAYAQTGKVGQGFDSATLDAAVKKTESS